MPVKMGYMVDRKHRDFTDEDIARNSLIHSRHFRTAR